MLYSCYEASVALGRSVLAAAWPACSVWWLWSRGADQSAALSLCVVGRSAVKDHCVAGAARAVPCDQSLQSFSVVIDVVGVPLMNSTVVTWPQSARGQLLYVSNYYIEVYAVCTDTICMPRTVVAFLIGMYTRYTYLLLLRLLIYRCNADADWFVFVLASFTFTARAIPPTTVISTKLVNGHSFCLDRDEKSWWKKFNSFFTGCRSCWSVAQPAASEHCVDVPLRN